MTVRRPRKSEHKLTDALAYLYKKDTLYGNDENVNRQIYEVLQAHFSYLPDLLRTQQIRELTGFSMTAIQRWVLEKRIIDRTVNWLREQPDSPLRDFDSMNRYCNRYERICAIKGALLPSCGFMVKTKRYVYMLRCTPVKGDYQFYIYCYQRKPFEKAQKEQQKNDRLAVKKRAEPER